MKGAQNRPWNIILYVEEWREDWGLEVKPEQAELPNPGKAEEEEGRLKENMPIKIQ